MGNQKIKRLKRILMVVGVIFFAGIILMQFFIALNMRKEIIHYTVNNVRSIAKEENLQISILVQDWFEQGRTLGSLCMVNGEYDAERAFEIVTTVNASSASQIAVFNAEGEGIGKDGESLDVSSETIEEMLSLQKKARIKKR